MIPRPMMTPAPTDEVPGPDLFMTVVKVADWPRAVAWYVDVLGLLAMLVDHEHQFALLAAGTGRLALQGDPRKSVGAPENFRLVFAVHDVDAEAERLRGRGVEISEPVENSREGYREIRLQDPEGAPLTLFSWTAMRQGLALDHPSG